MITLARLLLVENFLLEKNTGTKIRGTWLAKLWMGANAILVSSNSVIYLKTIPKFQGDVSKLGIHNLYT